MDRASPCLKIASIRENRPPMADGFSHIGEPLLLLVFALLIGNTARGLASRLTRGLAFAATAILCTLCEVTGFNGLDSFHTRYSFPRLLQDILSKNFRK
jgi:hypothetical protein